MLSTTLFTTFLLAMSATASPMQRDKPLGTLPISRRLNLTSVHNLVRHDQARAKALKVSGAKAAGNRRAVINEQVDNQAVTYVASVGVGSPATTYTLLVDTGSSNTWVGAGKAYVKTSTSVQTSNRVSVTYGSGSFSGTEFTDTVSLGNGLTATKQSIGVASTSDGFAGVDGILGIGPVDLTLGTLSPATTSSIPTVTDTLFSQGIISAHSIGISFEPTTVSDIVNGEISWGGTDSSKFTGPITFIPITSTSPSNQFWGINQTIQYGPNLLLFWHPQTMLESTAGIVDTGTTLVLIATDGFNKYKTATGGVLDSNTGLLRVTSSQLASLQSLTFTDSTGSFELTPNAQLFPRSLNTDIGGVAGNNYLIVNDLGTTSGEGLDFILGYAFLERFYSVFDTANNRVGFATTPFTTATTN